MAETWDGSRWAVTATPAPAGVIYSQLSAVSCPTAADCLAVGYSVDDAGADRTLAEAWNGTAWRLLPTPDPHGTVLAGFLGVSCASAVACVAVGTAGSPSATATLAEGWNGTAWRVLATVVPSGASAATLDTASCPAPAACTAAGYYVDSAGATLTLAERWNGTAWALQTTPDPRGATAAGLFGLSCPAPTSCAAVGTANGPAGVPATLAETWNGTGWRIEASAAPAHVRAAALYGVSCSGATTCTAVGDDVDAAGLTQPLAEDRTTSGWRLQPTPLPAGASSAGLFGVACPTAASCVAVGGAVDRAGVVETLAETWTAPGWRVGPTADPVGAMLSELAATSCPSVTRCIAVGEQAATASSGAAPLSEDWAGGAWRIVPVPAPVGAVSSQLTAVSCVAAGYCAAVGTADTPSGVGRTLAEAWTGSRWVVQATPNQSGASFGSTLTGVSCTASVACTAVGYGTPDGITDHPLAERWNGRSWTIQPTPAPSGGSPAQPVLMAVSCASADSCTAVGSYRDQSRTQVTLAENWDGHRWQVQPTPNPAGTTLSLLTGVSCASATACTAVGSWSDAAGTEFTLAESWNGRAWSIQPTPSVAGENSEIYAVSCPAAQTCTGVGRYNTPDGSFLSLVEAEHAGAWQRQAAADPAGTDLSFLMGLSCGGSAGCTAVGWRLPFQGVPVTLVEATSG